MLWFDTPALVSSHLFSRASWCGGPNRHVWKATSRPVNPPQHEEMQANAIKCPFTVITKSDDRIGALTGVRGINYGPSTKIWGSIGWCGRGANARILHHRATRAAGRCAHTKLAREVHRRHRHMSGTFGLQAGLEPTDASRGRALAVVHATDQRRHDGVRRWA